MQTIRIRLLLRTIKTKGNSQFNWRNSRRLAAGLALLFGLRGAGAQPSLQVLHWWTSDSERQAVQVLSKRLAAEKILWRDALIPSGSGVGAGIVLKSRVLAGKAPEVAQLNGAIFREWAQLGLLRELDDVASTGKWDKLLLPMIWQWVQPYGHVMAAPLGIHRVNTLFYNAKLFKHLGLAAPATWDEFETVAKKLHQAGMQPLAQSSEPWQVATLFENLVLAEAGADFYRSLLVNREAAAFYDARLARVLKHLRSLKKWMTAPVPEQTWPETARQFADGRAAMLLMGDWVKGELNAWGLATDVAFSCVAAPATATYHLYDIDTLVMLAHDGNRQAAQEKLAQVLLSTAAQTEYNQIKGSVPVLRNPDLSKMDSCARASWKTFARGAAAQVPSFAHRMATDEMSRDAIVAEIHRFFIDEKISVGEAQRRLAEIARTLPKQS